MLAKKIALGFGIAMILPMLVHYGVSTFCPEPKWEDYYSNDPVSESRKISPQEQEKKEAERHKKEEAYQKAKKNFGAHLFYFEVPIAILAVILGVFASVQAVGTGLLFGGIFCATDGYWEYWADLPDGLKFFSLLVCFATLLILGYRKLGDKK